MGEHDDYGDPDPTPGWPPPLWVVALVSLFILAGIAAVLAFCWGLMVDPGPNF